MAQVEYPVLIPVDSIQQLIDIVRNGQIIEQRARFGLEAWNVQGWLQAILLGTPDLVSTLDEDQAALASELLATLEGMEAPADVVGDPKLSPAVMALVTLLMALVRLLVMPKGAAE